MPGCPVETGVRTLAGRVRRRRTQGIDQRRQHHTALAPHTDVRRGLDDLHYSERGEPGQDFGTGSRGCGKQACHGGGRTAAPGIHCSRAQPQSSAIRGVQGHEDQGQTVGGGATARALGKEPGRGCGLAWIGWLPSWANQALQEAEESGEFRARESQRVGDVAFPPCAPHRHDDALQTSYPACGIGQRAGSQKTAVPERRKDIVGDSGLTDAEPAPEFRGPDPSGSVLGGGLGHQDQESQYGGVRGLGLPGSGYCRRHGGAQAALHGLAEPKRLGWSGVSVQARSRSWHCQ